MKDGAWVVFLEVREVLVALVVLPMASPWQEVVSVFSVDSRGQYEGRHFHRTRPALPSPRPGPGRSSQTINIYP